MLAAGRATSRLLLPNVLRRCGASQSATVCQKSLSESVEHAGRLVAAFIEVVCASGVFGLIISRYLTVC